MTTENQINLQNQSNSIELQKEENKDKKTFKFDRSFQDKIVQSMVIDHPWAAQFLEVLELDYFGFNYLKLVAFAYVKYYKSYKEFPSQELLLSIIKDELKESSDALLTEQVKILLKRIANNQDLGDLPFVKDQSLSWCKKMALTKALEKSISYAENEDDHEKIISVLQKAISSGNSHTTGLDLLDDIDVRYSETYRKTVPTGIKELDQRKILNGGLGAGELGIVVAPTGCHARGTLLCDSSGRLKAVEHFKLGDKLMGPDSKPRTILKLVHGREQMYEITPTKGDSFTVNANHILSLKRTNDGTSLAGTVVNLTVKDYLLKSKTFKHTHKLWNPEKINFESNDKKLSISPYIIGLLLSDGYINKIRIELTTKDSEMDQEFRNSATKFIPHEYKTSSVENRLQLLAGLIDTDGSLSNNCYDYTTKSKTLADDVAFVCRSLGLSAYYKTCNKSSQNGNMGTYYRMIISGNLEQIPCRLSYKRAKPRTQIKNNLLRGFSVKEMPVDDFFGLTVTDDHLYLMGDFTVSHNCGKSHILIHVGAQALLQGKNVAHYTFELNERNMGIRYDSHLLGINSTDCFEHKDKIKKFYQENTESLGTLRIKYYPTASATVMTLRAHLQKLATSGFRPDLILIDYAGIMRSTSKYELMRLELKKVCEELREFADENQVPVWTALQSNKEGASAEIVDLTNMAESYAQAHVADFVLGLSRQSSQKSKGFGNIFIAKNRAGMDGIKYPIHLDTARSFLKILSDDEVGNFLEDIEDEKKDNAMSVLRKTYREMNSINKH